VREVEGVRWTSKFTRKNVEKKYDIVLQNQGYNLANIFKKKANLKNIKIENNSVGIIPNLRVIERVNPEEIYLIYKSIIIKLINAKKTVYILRHSYEDLVICREIKKFFQSNENVILISDDLNAIELESIIKQFDFVIASRYHSIVHSYKNGVPALIIGWATKYFELSKDFDQVDYFFDCRNNMSIGEIDNKLDNMIKNYSNEKNKILYKINSIQKESIFDILTTDFLY
jgi:colanic acid/amylovoran biosynthesis protein